MMNTPFSLRSDVRHTIRDQGEFNPETTSKICRCGNSYTIKAKSGPETRRNYKTKRTATNWLTKLTVKSSSTLSFTIFPKTLCLSKPHLVYTTKTSSKKESTQFFRFLTLMKTESYHPIRSEFKILPKTHLSSSNLSSKKWTNSMLNWTTTNSKRQSSTYWTTQTLIRKDFF